MDVVIAARESTSTPSRSKITAVPSKFPAFPQADLGAEAEHGGMSTPPPPDRAALGRERLAARARRISVIRRRVVAITLATFALAWGAIAWDGSMGAQSASTATAQVATTASATGTTTSSDDTTASSGTSSSSGSGSTLTTSQS